MSRKANADTYKPYQLCQSHKVVPAPAYALLADLQSTTAHLNRDNHNAYQSSHSPTHTTPELHQLTPVNVDVQKYYKNDSSPTGHNMKEVTVTTTTYRNNVGGGHASPALNSNLSELDSLLDDLSTSRYNSYGDGKVAGSPTAANGPASGYKSISPTGSMGSGGGLQDMRPTVESLLDELQSAVPANHHASRHPERQVVTTVTTTKTTHHPRPMSPSTGRPPSPSMGRPLSPSAGHPSTPSASSATKELDDLMASLSDFKISSAPTPSNATITTSDPLYAKPNKPKASPGAPGGQHRNNHLDSMLGTLQSDMSRQGINTAQKGCCAACNKPIVGQVVTALAKTWHPEHFTCAHCHQELGTKNFFERDGQPYCETDYHNLFSPRCAYCNGPILDKCVSALEKTWHPEHFFCAQCGNQFGEDGFHEKEGKPYCKSDYFEMFAPKCGGCSRPIMENYISALNTQWHPECFVCRDCQTPFNGGSFFDHEGMPYCETHYHAKRGSLCAGCHKPITGRCITAMFQKFHPEHFVCSFCLKQLNKGTFKEQNDKPYCHNCFDKLFG